MSASLSRIASAMTVRARSQPIDVFRRPMVCGEAQRRARLSCEALGDLSQGDRFRSALAHLRKSQAGSLLRQRGGGVPSVSTERGRQAAVDRATLIGAIRLADDSVCAAGASRAGGRSTREGGKGRRRADPARVSTGEDQRGGVPKLDRDAAPPVVDRCFTRKKHRLCQSFDKVVDLGTSQ